MKAFSSLDDLYDDLERVARLKIRGAGTLGTRLAEHREAVYLAQRLTRISCDLPLGVGAQGLTRRPPDLAALSRLYDTLGFGPFLRRQGTRLAQLPIAYA
jgi:DNA polymerase-1